MDAERTICAICGTPLGPGTPWYASRRRAPAGMTGWICDDCGTPASPRTDGFSADIPMIAGQKANVTGMVIKGVSQSRQPGGPRQS